MTKLKDLQFTPGPIIRLGITRKVHLNNWVAIGQNTINDSFVPVTAYVETENDAALYSHAPKMLELLKQTKTILTPIVGKMEMKRNVTGYFWNTEVDSMRKLLTEINNLLNS